MKASRSFRTCLFVPALLLSAGAAPAEDGVCSIWNAAGRWGYSVTGTNTTGAPDGIVGNGVVGAKGNVFLRQTEVTNGQVREGKLEGTLAVNRDCTAKLTAKLYESGQLVVTTTWAMTFVDNQKELRGILTSLVLPDGSSAPLPVQTLEAKMAFP